MDTWFFWGFALVAIVASLLVVSQRQAARAVVMLAVLLAATGGLYILLSAPIVAVVQIGVGGAALLLLVLPATLWLDVPSDGDGRAIPVPGAGVRSFGVVLSVVFLTELAWAFRRVRGADLPSIADPSEGGALAFFESIFTSQAAGLAMASMLVFVAMVGILLLVRRD